MRKEDNPVLTRIATLAPKTVIDGIRVFTAGEREHWVELMSGWDCKEKLLVTCSDSELVDIVNQVRNEINSGRGSVDQKGIKERKRQTLGD